MTFLPAEHATIGGNQQLADQVRAAVPGLDVLVNNVGGVYARRQETTDGYEATLGMNFIGPVTLTGELLPLLRARAPARCINVVSAAFNGHGSSAVSWRLKPRQGRPARSRDSPKPLPA